MTPLSLPSSVQRSPPVGVHPGPVAGPRPMSPDYPLGGPDQRDIPDY